MKQTDANGGPPAAARERFWDRRDTAWMVAVVVVLWVATSIPAVYGYLSAPADKWFSGVVYNVHDTAQYYSWMREYGSRMFIDNRLTAEPNPAIYFNLHWWIPGRVAALLGLGLPQIYQLLRLAAIPLAVAALMALIKLVVAGRTLQRFAFSLALLSSGLGWIWVAKKYLVPPYTLDYPTDVYTLGGNTFWVMTAAPHLVLALAAMLLALVLAYRSYRGGWGWAVAAGLATLFLGMGHIYDVVTVWAVLAAFGLLATLRDGWRWRTAARLGTVVAMSAPAPLYWGWVSSDANPLWKQALAQYDNLGVFTPDPVHLLIFMGLALILALVTWDGVVPLKQQSDAQLFIKGWFGINLLIIYLPLKFQITLLNGFEVPVAVLATWGLYHRVLPYLEERLARRRAGKVGGAGQAGGQGAAAMPATSRPWLRRWAPILLLAAVLPTNLYLTAWRVLDLGRHDYPYYLARDDVAALDWLEEHVTPDDVVLSSFTIGHYLPGFTGARAFLANAVMTMDYNSKYDIVTAFYGDRVTDAQRAELLRQYGITYLFYGPAERALGGYDPAGSALFEAAYVGQDTAIYRVTAQVLGGR